MMRFKRSQELNAAKRQLEQEHVLASRLEKGWHRAWDEQRGRLSVVPIPRPARGILLCHGLMPRLWRQQPCVVPYWGEAMSPRRRSNCPVIMPAGARAWKEEGR